MPGPEPIAIVGMACRFPGGPGLAAFWQLLVNGRDAVGELPSDRLAAGAEAGPALSRRGGFLDGIGDFDAAFFEISPREAERMDPQQRLLLEVSWEALEDAGVPADRLLGSGTGVFVGLWLSDYEEHLFRGAGGADFYMTTGSGRYSASGRISYLLGLQGPSLTVDTACSSSLVAVHLACQSLWTGESELALAGGANVILQPHISQAYARSGMLAADGHCKFGDARADGYVRSEGAGVVVLKPLGSALAARDRVYAVIRGSAVGNDGQTSGSLGTPGMAGQVRVLREAYQRAAVAPHDVGYVEAHGTGTAAGDPVELQALATVLGDGRPARRRPCLVGSVKTNIGHTEGAAGIAGLIKAALILHHELIPPSLNFETPNPRIPWEKLPLAIVERATAWPAEGRPRLAGISAFGIAGTDAHVVLEQAPLRPSPAMSSTESVDRGARLLPLSAKTSPALRALAEQWIPRLEDDTVYAAIDDLCYTASGRRTHYGERLGVVGTTLGELADHLRAYVRGESRAGIVSSRVRDSRPRVVFVFPGQGSQWLGMGRSLLTTEPVFAEALERCARSLAPHVSWSLRDELMADARGSHLERIDVVQPALFAIQVALAALWRAWGVEPDAVIGHSMGEVAAAHVAGALSLEDAARVIATRSRLLRAIAGRGAMAMVELSLDDARRALAGREDRLSVAVSNSARSTVISGDVATLDELLAGLERGGVFCRRVKVDVASHSPQVDVIRADLLAGLKGILPRAAELPLYSTVTGTVADGTALGPEYWAQNLREPVLFSGALARLAADGYDTFIEVSSHPVLVSAVQDTVRQSGLDAGLVLPSARREEDERAVMLESLAALWTRGYPVEWGRFHGDGHRLLPGPTYPWQRERFWYEAGRQRSTRWTTAHSFLTTHVRLGALATGAELWEGRIASADNPCVPSGGVTPLSIAACLAAVLSVTTATRSGRFTLTDLEFPSELRLGDEVTIQLVLQPGTGGTQDVRLVGQATGGSTWATLARAAVVFDPPDDGATVDGHDLDAIRARTQAMDLSGMVGMPGHGHRGSLVALRVGVGESLGRVDRGSTPEPCALHPETLDAGVWALAATSAHTSDEEFPTSGRMTGVRGIRVHAPLDRTAWIYAVERSGSMGNRIGDLWFLDETGMPVLELQGVQLAPGNTESVEGLFYRVDWRPGPRLVPRTSRMSGRWLIVANGQEQAAALVASVEASGGRCVVVSAAEALAGEIDGALDSPGPPFVACIHLASVDLDPGVSPTVPGAADFGWASALALLQALARRTEGTPPRLWLITRGAQCATSADVSVSLSAAALWGLGAVVAYEHPGLRATRVDLGPVSGTLDAAALIEELAANDAEDEVALRGGTRYVARLVSRAPEGGAGARGPGATVVRADSEYLITGGLGGLGLAVARWLVARGARHLTLMGRRPPSSDAMKVLHELRAAGVDVSIAPGDVSRRDDVQRVVGRASAHRPLRGVIHAAGSLDDGLLTNLDRGRFGRVMAPKVDGAIHLDEATRDTPLDFFVCFSSALGVLGSPGVASYAAANACLDAVALQRRDRPMISVAWGPWARLGMAGDRAAAPELRRLAPEAGLEALGRILAGPAAPALVMRFDPARWSRAYAAAAVSLLRGLHIASTPAAATSMLAQLRAAAPGQRRELLERHLQEQIGHVLRTAPGRVDPGVPLKSLGLNSLMFLELRNRLEATLGLTLPVTLFYNYPTMVAVAAHLEERLGLAVPAGSAALAEDDVELDRLVAEIQELSDEDVRRLLAEGQTGPRDE